MTTKNLKIFHELNRLKTEEWEKDFAQALADKEATKQAREGKKDSGHARAIIGGPVRVLRVNPIVEEQKAIIKEVKTQINNKAKELGVEVNNIVCDICGDSFSSKGFPTHYRSCMKKQQLEAEKEELQKQVEELKAKKAEEINE